jgi:two-component system sensor histidine kinase EvgS
MAPEHPLRELIAGRFPTIRIVDAANGNDAMDRVARGEADAAVEVKLFANLRINGDNDGLLRATTSVDELPAQFHFATTHRAAELVPLIDRAIADIPAAEKQRMLRRWVAVDLHPAFPWRRWLPLIVLAAMALLVLAGLTLWWMRRLRREVQVRRRSEELLNDIATTMPGVAFRYTLDETGAMSGRYVSPGARAFFGIELDPHASVLASLAPQLRDDQRDAALALEQASLKSGERFKTTVAYRHPDGRERWLHAEAVQTRATLRGTAWTGFVVDVSSERELQARLAREAEARTLLLATASHELRAPTHNLSLALQSIAIDSLAPGQATAMRIAIRSAQTLGQLLNDVLDAARFESGPMRLRPRAFDLRELLDELREAWAAEAQDKGLAFEMAVDAEVPATLHADPLRLKQILTNLLSNACKYTDAGRVGFQVAREGEALRFVVRDTGAGITEAARERLFMPFVTLDDERNPAAPEASSGLGLVVSRKLAELMGGRIALHSEPGRGTEFTLHLPLAKPLRDEPAPADAPPAGEDVVVCDDDATSRLLMVHMLRSHGLRVHEAATARAAFEIWRRGGVCVLVTDLDLQGEQGDDLIRAVREAENERSGRTLVIVCSGSSAPAPARPGESPLHDAYLQKPVQVAALLDTLRQLGVPVAAQASHGRRDGGDEERRLSLRGTSDSGH